MRYLCHRLCAIVCATDVVKKKGGEEEPPPSSWSCGVMEVQEAIDLYTESIQEDSSNPILYELRAQKHLMAGHFAEAEADRQRALELNLNAATDSVAINNRAEASFELPETDELGQSSSDEDEMDEDGFFDEDEPGLSEQESFSEMPLTEEDVQQLVDELLEIENLAAEAQENLEEESLLSVRRDVRAELALKLSGLELDGAIENEMTTYTDLWQDALDDLEDRTALLQERLDDAGIDLPCLFKLVEKRSQEGCRTETWKNRVHWAGLAAAQEFEDAVNKAESYLESRNPVNRHRGKLMEEGASGYIEKKLASYSGNEEFGTRQGESWNLYNALLKSGEDGGNGSIVGSNSWAFLYMASTPKQAASFGLPGAEQVEELEDIENCKDDPLYAAAVENEKESGLTEQQCKNIKKVREEDDIRKARLLQRMMFKRFRKSNRSNAARTTSSIQLVKESQEEAIRSCKRGFSEDFEQQSSKKRLATITDNLSIPVVDDRCIQTDYDSRLHSVGICNSSHDLGEAKVQNTIINIDSDEEQETVTYGDTGRHLENKSMDDNKIINIGDNVYEAEVTSVSESSGYCAEAEPTLVEDIGGKDARGFTNECVISEQILSEVRTNNINQLCFICTCCGCQLKAFEVMKHPMLEVAICRQCKKYYQSGPFAKDEDGSETECRWCGDGGDVVLCEKCEKVFCQTCIRRNFGEKMLQHILETDWVCFCCNREPLKALTEKLQEALHADDELFSSQGDTSSFYEDESVSTDSENEVRVKFRYRKDFKRIGDMLKQGDNETSVREDSGICMINLAKDDRQELMLPNILSQCLKPHQIEGVRFMWENCIGSVNGAGDAGKGCVLAHNMGLGKTLQVIAFLYAALRKDTGLRTALIVVPVNVLQNWPEEFEKWAPCGMDHIKVFVADETIRDNFQRIKLLKRWQRKGGVMIIGYTAFRNLSMGKNIREKSWQEKICNALQNPGPDILVCDEAHMIKNREADITQVLKLIKTHRRIALTGSPLQNNLMEYYCMVDFVREGFLGTPNNFKRRFQKPIENGQHADSTEAEVKKMKHRAHVLHEKLKTFVQRMGVNVVEQDLPPKQVYVISVRLSELQRSLYNRFIEHFWLLKEQKISTQKSRKCLFNTYHGLSKIWNHPDLLRISREERGKENEDILGDFIVDEDDDMSTEDGTGHYEHPKEEDARNKPKVASRKDNLQINEIMNLDWCNDLLSDKHYGVLEFGGKMVILMDLLSMCSAIGEKALVFSQSLSTLDLIETFLEKLQRVEEKEYWKKDEDWYRLDGQTKAKARQQLVHRFNDPHNTIVKCMLISTRAGSLGMNLQAASRVIIIDGSWNPTHDIQAFFRSWRYGQTKPVIAYRLLAYGTAEEKIYKRQVLKESLAAMVLDEQHVERHSKMEELRVLFKLTENTSICDMKGEWKEGSADMRALGYNCSSQIPLNTSFFTPEDNIMASLLIDYYPRLIVKVHQHERLLDEVEDEKLSAEEQAIAWQDFRNADIEWVEEEQHGAFQVHNSWSASRVSEELYLCDPRAHIDLLIEKTVKPGFTIKCDNCNQDIAWETISKRRPRKRH